MKALTLTQPWATLVAIHAKRQETRSWRTSYRGRLAIHAAKGFPREASDLSRCRRLCEMVGPTYTYPLGAVIATAWLSDCVPVEDLLALSAEEEMWGNYDAGRFAWLLSDVKRLAEPVPAKGALGLWEWVA